VRARTTEAKYKQNLYKTNEKHKAKELVGQYPLIVVFLKNGETCFNLKYEGNYKQLNYNFELSDSSTLNIKQKSIFFLTFFSFVFSSSSSGFCL